MGFPIISSSTSSLSILSLPIIKNPNYTPKITKRFNFRRTRIVSSSSSSISPESPASSSEPISSTISDSSNSNHALANPNGNPVLKFVQHTESTVERVIFDFRFLALLAIGGSLAGSVLCFLNGCVYVFEAYKVYWSSCVKGIHTGNMVLRLVEAIDVYLAGTVMFVFAMGLYGLFITNTTSNVNPSYDRALKGSSLFGMFALK